MPRKKKELITTHSAKEKLCGLHFSNDMSGKMQGIDTISTSCYSNPFCRMRMQDERTVCHHCYSARTQDRYPQMQPLLEENYNIFRKGIPDVVPYTTSALFRFQAFGEVGFLNEVIYYFLMCYKNPQTKFAIWVKRIDFLRKAIENGYEKPDNLQVVYSSLYVNKPSPNPDPSIVDRVFTVYTKDYAKEHNIYVNCGENICFLCQKCYNADGDKVINEIIK